jgi:Tfp pilus assembly protein PilX
MIRTSMRQKGNTGSVLILAVGYLMVVTLFATAFMTGIHRSLTQASRMERRQVCMDAAEGGLNQAVALLRTDPGYRGEHETPLGRGCFTVEVTPAAGERTYSVVSRGEIIDAGQVVASAQITALVRFRKDGSVERLTWMEVATR